MRTMSKEFETMAKDLGLYRNILNVDSLERFAADLNVTTQTLRNFESGSCYNMTIMLYYFYRIDEVLDENVKLFDNCVDIEKQFEQMMNVETSGTYEKHKRMMFDRNNHIY